MTTTPTSVQRFRQVYIFAKSPDATITDVRPVLNEVQKLAGHIPKWYDVSPEDRAFVARLVENITHHGSSIVVFSLDEQVTDADCERRLQLLEELAQKGANRKWLLDSGIAMCAYGFSGLHGTVLKELQALQKEQGGDQSSAAPTRQESRSTTKPC